jgi:glucosamine--fructose-6-phosphate aminotransferase (isomerizing)
MENKLWNDIQAQGANLRHVVEHLYGPERERIETAAKFLRSDRPFVLIGVASASYLCIPAEIFLAQRGRSASTLTASDALYSYLPALKRANVIINSRSGETVEIVKLARALVEQKIPFVAITNEPGSTLARLATHIVWADTHKDELVSINVVTGMMLATLVLAAAVTGEMDSMHPKFLQAAEMMPGVVEQATRVGPAFLKLFRGIRPIHLLHRGPARGTALCGRLALEEIARTPGVPVDASEFRQGPNEVVDDRFGAVIFVPDGRQGELNRSLAEDLVASGGRVLLVGEVEPREDTRMLTFPVRGLADTLRPVLEIVPLQVLAYHLAQAQGYEPGHVRYITKVIVTEEGIPKKNE